jgi:hypothetical protein
MQIDTIRSAAQDLEKVEVIILQKKGLLKNNKDIKTQTDYLLNLMVWNGCSGK